MYYTIKFNVNLDSVCYNNGFVVFMEDCTAKVGWNLNVQLNRLDLRKYAVSVELNDEDIYRMPIREALAYILNKGKYAFKQADYSIEFFYRDTKAHYGILEYNGDGERTFCYR